jgi:hypothetical protein
VPILIIGEEEEKIENFINELISLNSFRNSLIFLSDFNTIADYNQILEYEEFDLNNERNFFLSFPSTTKIMIEKFDNYKSWIIGVAVDKDNYQLSTKVHNKLFLNTDFFLQLEMVSTKLKAEIVGKVFPNLDISLEKWVYQNAINRTEIEVEKMKRVLLKKTRFTKISKEQLEMLMDFEDEEAEIKENIIKKEIQNFFNACKRSINVLNRMKILCNLNISAHLSPKTLFSTIAYKNASIERILEFILNEWNQDFFSLMNFKQISNFSDTFESLWG